MTFLVSKDPLLHADLVNLVAIHTFLYRITAVTPQIGKLHAYMPEHYLL